MSQAPAVTMIRPQGATLAQPAAPYPQTVAAAEHPALWRAARGGGPAGRDAESARVRVGGQESVGPARSS
ncbi:hypothetical protein ACFFHJ_22665 [Planotetraspora thailandica]|uniref:hypothetical protein n=1 Tax=Planotetraspora thailandica TaxID=487172 RepID=UPI001951F35A|nr:hypothetical protein [Planotetraspora thailandica]